MASAFRRVGATRDGRRLVVRPATPEDAAPLLALQRAVLDEGRFFITEPDELTESVESKALSIKDLNSATNSTWLVAEVERTLAGMVLIRGGVLRRMQHAGKLEIMVDSGFRRYGVGDALMAAALEWAVENRTLKKVGLNVFAHNARAIALYERHGFKREGFRPGEYRLRDGSSWDDVLMYRAV